MNILLIGMPFYGYEKHIISGFKNQGHSIDFYYDTSVFQKVSPKIIPNSTKKSINNLYLDSIKKRISKKTYDLFICIVGRNLTENFVSFIKDKKIAKKNILYLWDEIGRVENFSNVSRYYDKIYSFDLNDCTNFNFNFLPLFYIDIFKHSNNKRNIDIYTAFNNHSDREKIINNINLKYPEYSTFFYIIIGKFAYLKNVLFKTNKNVQFSTKPLSIQKNYTNIINSKTVLDIQFPTQSGLTLRSLETLASGTKLITTNSLIKKYVFFNEQNILIINRDNPVISENFLNTPFEPYSDDILNRFSLNNWINVITDKKSFIYLK